MERGGEREGSEEGRLLQTLFSFEAKRESHFENTNDEARIYAKTRAAFWPGVRGAKSSGTYRLP